MTAPPTREASPGSPLMTIDESIKDVNYISRSVLFHYSKSSVKWKYLCKKREVTSSGDVNMSVSPRFLPPSAHQVGLVKLISGREIPAVIVFLSGIRDLI